MSAILSILRWRPWFLQESDSRQNLLESLQGRSVNIPDLQSLFREWPQGVSPELGRLENDINEKLKILTQHLRLFPEVKRREKMKAADTALFSATWWPYADFEALRTVTYLSIRLFAWDDDSCEFSTLCTDIVKATEFRSETINYINKSLGISYDPKPVETPSNAIIPMFGEIGERFRQSSSLGNSLPTSSYFP
ncbi:Terpenoid synthase protein [Rutstroemia sp. NJR-2017a BBW]|nr:Terpenoid synthase protein [Rutstroemia sp. NJR-2017a BBW]